MDQLCDCILNNKEWVTYEVIYYMKSINEGKDIAIDKDIIQKGIYDTVKYIREYKEIKEVKEIISSSVIKIYEIIENKMNKGYFISMIKSFKWSFIELVKNTSFSSEQKYKYYVFIEKMFDEFEISFYKQWTKASESDIKFKGLAETMTSSIFIHNGNNFLYVNPITEDFTGYTKKELYGMKVWEIIHPYYRKFVRELAEGLHRNNKNRSCSYEIKILTKENEQKSIMVNRSPIILGGEKVVIGVGVDDTKRKEMQKTIKENEKKIEGLLQTCNIGIEITKKTELIYLNTYMANITGYSKEELLCMSIYDIIHNDFKEVFCNLINSDENKKWFKCEMKILKRNGEERWVDVSGSRLKIDNERYNIVCFNDITEQKNINEKLKQREEDHKRLLEFLPDTVLVRKDNKILYINSAGIKLFGYENCNELIGKKFSDLFNIVWCNRKGLHDQKLLNIKENVLVEKRVKRKKDGKVLDIEIAESCCTFQNEKVRITICRDISHKKKIERLKKNMEIKTKQLREIREYDKLKTEFFSNMSHELRTPLNVILGAIQLLNIMSDNSTIVGKGRLKKYLSVIKQNCYRLIKLSNNLLDITKIDSGYFKMKINNYDIIDIINDIIKSVDKYIQKKHINMEFTTELKESIVACDYEMIERSVLNLLSNAVKFTPKYGTIKIRVYNLDKYISISVRDNGIGIPKNKQKLIFHKFVQVDKSLSRNAEGTGMGLSIVKSLVELHQGKVCLKSELGKGSEFKILLPNKKINKFDSKIYIDNYINQCAIKNVDIEFSDIYA
ncbi:PAS domain S-box protein [Haloimpatiens sp. FM7330]|uniref:PAS domain S-box protein n=1 Tax=Haloimpatiens sp. FM7330 TaxID=3298610 RepID=UPI003639FA60